MSVMVLRCVKSIRRAKQTPLEAGFERSIKLRGDAGLSGRRLRTKSRACYGSRRQVPEPALQRELRRTVAVPRAIGTNTMDVLAL